jgi:hypothetical protein
VLVVPYDGSNCVNVGGFEPHHGHKHFNNTCINGVSPLAAPSGCGVPACADPHRAPPDMRTVANIDDCAGRRGRRSAPLPHYALFPWLGMRFASRHPAAPRARGRRTSRTRPPHLAHAATHLTRLYAE